MGKEKLSFGAAWAMAVGGMIGGGIFATLGVVIMLAGEWAWLSFLIGGLIALATGQSYARLTTRFDEEGGYSPSCAKPGTSGSPRRSRGS